MNMHTEYIAKRLKCSIAYALIIQEVIDCYFDIRWSESSARTLNAAIKDAVEFYNEHDLNIPEK